MLARPRQARFDRAHRHIQRARNFVVAEAIDFAQYQDGPLVERQAIEGGPHVLGRFPLLCHLVRFCERPCVGQVAMLGDMLVKCDLL